LFINSLNDWEGITEINELNALLNADYFNSGEAKKSVKETAPSQKAIDDLQFEQKKIVEKLLNYDRSTLSFKD
jgi:Spy/CpxP family protein refolding chaperone